VPGRQQERITRVLPTRTRGCQLRPSSAERIDQIVAASPS
jgi:hypothetical protein